MFCLFSVVFVFLSPITLEIYLKFVGEVAELAATPQAFGAAPHGDSCFASTRAVPPVRFARNAVNYAQRFVVVIIVEREVLVFFDEAAVGESDRFNFGLKVWGKWFSVFWPGKLAYLPFDFFWESSPEALVFGSHVCLSVCVFLPNKVPEF